VHSLDEARAAARAGAAWLFFGPVYDTPSKRAYGAPQGLAALAQVVRSVDIPVIAIGGITAERVPEVHAAGAAGIAVISAILAADSPGDATRRLLAAIEATRSREAFTRDVAPTPRAVVLLSGGLDSTTLLALARREGFAVHALTFRYGQRHAVEIEAARRVAARGGAAEHRIVEVDLRAFGGSALTADIAVPKDRAPADMGHDIPITYVPARNTIFLSFALAWAEVLGAADIFIGVNALDYSGYPDCRPEYIAAYEGMANLATKAAVEGRQRVRIHTPLIGMTKAEIIRRGLELDVDYALTLSCYDPAADGAACGRCDACRLRLKGFAEAGRQDPAIYRTI
jgi:7-cyano-7-deazaguanine synthase